MLNIHLTKIFALRSLIKILALKKIRCAIGELIHLHNAKLQLDLYHKNVVIMDLCNTGILIDVNINAHHPDTANGISNQKMDHH
jgi:hypothetical protein